MFYTVIFCDTPKNVREKANEFLKNMPEEQFISIHTTSHLDSTGANMMTVTILCQA